VAHDGNPSYLGGGDGEDYTSSPAWRKVIKNPISTNKMDMVVHTCSYMGGIGRRTKV
jgi:hypothetical protein